MRIRSSHGYRLWVGGTVATLALCSVIAPSWSRSKERPAGNAGAATSPYPYADTVDTSGPVPIPMEGTTFPSDTPNPFAVAGDDFRVDTHDDAMLEAAADSLDRFPPALTVSPERRDALMLLDSVFHDPYARERKAVQDFHLQRAEKVVEELEKTHVTDDGAHIWMFYNMGFVVRTRSVTLGFDLISCRHLPGFMLPDALMKRLVAQCDVLFISHTHWDHADPGLAQEFIDAGKPVVGPPDLWAGYPINAKLAPLNRKAGIAQTLVLKDGQRKLEVTINPGFQHMKEGPDVTNNVYLVRTPEDLCIGHTGDNNGYLPDGFEWIDDVHKHGKVDVLLFNDWTQMVPRTLRGFDPKLVIAGHFDELGHENLWARAPYWRGLVHGDKSAPTWPWLTMAWGESFDYQPAQFRSAGGNPAASK